MFAPAPPIDNSRLMVLEWTALDGRLSMGNSRWTNLGGWLSMDDSGIHDSQYLDGRLSMDDSRWTTLDGWFWMDDSGIHDFRYLDGWLSVDDSRWMILDDKAKELRQDLARAKVSTWHSGVRCSMQGFGQIATTTHLDVKSNWIIRGVESGWRQRGWCCWWWWFNRERERAPSEGSTVCLPGGSMDGSGDDD